MINNLIKSILTNISLPRKEAYKKYATTSYWPPTEHQPLQDELLFHTDFRDKMSRALSLAIEIQTIFTECGILYEEEISTQKENENHEIRKQLRDILSRSMAEEDAVINLNPTTSIS